jgi:hypothetical protein
MIVSMNAGARCAQMLIEMSRRDREMNDAIDDAETAAENDAHIRELEERTDAADAKCRGGIGAGLLEIGGGAAGAVGAGTQTEWMHEAAPALKGGSTCVSALGEHSGAIHDLSASREKNRAEEHERTATRARHDTDQAGAQAQKAVDLAAEVASTQARIDLLVVRG